jgi:hypothetical protein
MIYTTEQIEGVLQQYEKQKEILENAGILSTFRNGEKGIMGINGSFYVLPSLEEIRNRANNNREMLETKIGQGFTKLLLTPFGMSLNVLHEKVSDVILRHANEGKFFATKKGPNDPDEKLIPLELNKNQPFWTWDKYKNADINGTIIYGFTEFPQNVSASPVRFGTSQAVVSHQGKTKQEILDSSSGGASAGWYISFIENIPNLPVEKEGKTIGERKQHEANKSPVDYLSLLQTERMYANEEGITPEDWAIYFLSYLEETNQIVDDYEGVGNVSWNLGAYFPENSGVPTACFVRSVNQVRVGSLGARYFGPVYCARTVVRI